MRRLKRHIFSVNCSLMNGFREGGYGRSATKLVLDSMKREGKYNKVILCYIEGNDAAKKLYEGFGFVETDRDEDEILMELKL